MSNYHNKGFTLVELLVVISIIAILSVIGLTLFNVAQQNARDARRKADIDAIASALEIKRAPGVVYYKTLVNADMSSGLIPEDAVNGLAKYCIKLYTTDAGAQEDNPLITDWAPGSPPVAQACPTGFKEAKIGSGNGFDNAASGFFLDNTNKSFKLCVKLEGPSGGSVYCKNSAQ